MTEEQAIALAEKYAVTWGVPWGVVTKVERRRAWWLLFQIEEYVLFFESNCGIGEVHVNNRYRSINQFEFFPNDVEHFMIPLWAAYPNFDDVTIGWRMGPGEDYKFRWHDWYRGLTDARRAEYKRRYPTPKEECFSWYGFYERCADVRGDPTSIMDQILGRIP